MPTSVLTTEVVVTVHGVETLGEWQTKVTPIFSGIAGLIHIPHVYGRFAFWKTVVPLFRHREIERLYVLLAEIQKDYPRARRFVIAHSFGTYLLCEVLARRPEIRLDTVVLCGSIVACDFDWTSVVAERRVRYVRNEIASDDPVVRLFKWRWARALIPRSGPSGIEGFSQSPPVEQQRFRFATHSSCFMSTLHCLTYWMPFLRKTRSFQDLCRRCADCEEPDHMSAMIEFGLTHDAAIRQALDRAFPAEDDEALAAYYTVVRHWIIQEGANGTRHFDELLNCFIRELVKYVS